jgi:hypothetical protein
MDTYAAGEAWAVGVILGVLIVLNGLEVLCELKDWPSITYRVGTWSRSNPWFVGLLLAVLGAFLAHFFLDPLPPAG